MVIVQSPHVRLAGPKYMVCENCFPVCLYIVGVIFLEFAGYHGAAVHLRRGDGLGHFPDERCHWCIVNEWIVAVVWLVPRPPYLDRWQFFFGICLLESFHETFHCLPILLECWWVGRTWRFELSWFAFP